MCYNLKDELLVFTRSYQTLLKNFSVTNVLAYFVRPTVTKKIKLATLTWARAFDVSLEVSDFGISLCFVFFLVEQTLVEADLHQSGPSSKRTFIEADLCQSGPLSKQTFVKADIGRSGHWSIIK